MSLSVRFPVRAVIGALCGVLLAIPLATVQADAAEGQEVRIVRDGFGVPHVYSDTLEGVAYGAGFAIAEDRLFQMDVLRAAGKGTFSELFGPLFVGMDVTARRIWYTDAERMAKFNRLSERLRRMIPAYVDGINAYISEARSDPSKLPMEYTSLGIGPPRDWAITDSIAIADFLVETFGSGGGSELEQSLLLKFFQDKYGATEGPAAFNDVRWINDPASPPSIPADVDWREEPSLARELPAKNWRRDARIGLSEADRQPAGAAPAGRPAVGTRAQAGLVPDNRSRQSREEYDAHTAGKAKLLEIVNFGSNAMISGPGRTTSGGTLQLGGPQVGHFVPEAIAEFGLHAPKEGLDMVGLTFAGAGPAVLIGRGPDFSFTTTTGNSDGADLYVEKLGPNAETYVYDGKVEKMDCRNESIRTKGSITVRNERICRTRHGPVLSTDSANGVAYAIRRSWFDMETGTLEGFFGYNFVDDIEDFATEANKLQSNHNMFYTNHRGDFGYWHPGALPLRALGTDVRLPQDGSTSATEWQRLRTSEEVPHAANFDRGWLANWNNKPAVDWDNGDGANYGAVFRNKLWNDLLDADPEMTFTDVEAFNRINATSELEFTFFRDHIVRAGAASDDAQVRSAAAALATWDARREDNDDNDLVDSEPGYSLWKNWRTIARKMAFEDDLDTFAGRASDSMLLHVLDGDDASLVKSRDYLNDEPTDTFINRVMRANLDALATEFGSSDFSKFRSKMPKQRYTRLNARFFDCEVARVAGPNTCANDSLPGNVPDLDFMNRGTYNHIVEFRPTGLPGGSDDGGDGGTVEALPGGSGRAGGSGGSGGSAGRPGTSGGGGSGTLAATGAPAPWLAGVALLSTLALVAARDRRRVGVLVGVLALMALAAAPGLAAQSFVEPREGYEVEAESIISPGQSGFISQSGQQSPHYENQHQLYATWRYKPMPLREEDVRKLGGDNVKVLTYDGS